MFFYYYFIKNVLKTSKKCILYKKKCTSNAFLILSNSQIIRFHRPVFSPTALNITYTELLVLANLKSPQEQLTLLLQ